jgi:hypothetical protein
MDGTGVPVVKKDTVGRQGKTGGQPAHTREAKLGCVFTQTTWDQTKGYAIRDADSTTYVGAIETAEESGKRIYPEAWNRGWSRAEKKVVMGDGAEWISASMRPRILYSSAPSSNAWNGSPALPASMFGPRWTGVVTSFEAGA